MALLVLPDEVVLNLVDDDGNPLRIANVLFRIHLFANHKNDFFLQPFATDDNGSAHICKRDLLAEVSAHYDSGLMDYAPVENCRPEVEIIPLTPDDVQRVLDSRTKNWTMLLGGEEERWGSLENLLNVYRGANNARVTVSPMSQLWDGTQRRCESCVRAKMQ